MELWNNLRQLWQKSQVAAVAGTLHKGRLSSTGHGNGLSFQEAVNKGYKNLIWIHRCVAALGAAVGSVPWKAYETVNGVEKPVANHPAERLLEYPNPHYTRKELMDAWAIYLSLSGNSFFEIVFVQGKPYELYVLRPDWMTPLPDAVNYLAGYKMDAGSNGKATFKVDEVMHFKYLDPLNEYVGMSPLSAAARTIATEDSAIRWNKTIFDNSAVPNGMLEVPATGMKKAERDKLKEELEREFTQDNMHRPMVLWGGMKWSKMAMDAKDLDFLNQRHMNKFEMCAILETPPAIVGANEDPTYANYDVARTAYWEDNVIQKLEWFQAKYNVMVRRYWPNIVVKYDISDVPAMRASFAAKVDTSKTLWMMGYPINAINKRVGLGFAEVPWGNAWWAPMNMMPVTSEEQPALTDQNPLQRPQPEGTGIDPFTGEPIDQTQQD